MLLVIEKTLNSPAIHWQQYKRQQLKSIDRLIKFTKEKKSQARARDFDFYKRKKEAEFL